jgi:PrtD family type I secretion system ABC transporter
MAADTNQNGAEELRAFRRQSRALYWIVALFSLFATLLTLTGPIYMLQVYDRVLGSGSQETLVALSLLVVFLYCVLGLLDGARARISSRIAARFQTAAEARVFDATLRQRHPAAATGLNDLDAICRGLSAQIIGAIFDLPWTPIFFAVIFVFHPLLGLLSVAGAIALIVITCANQVFSRRDQTHATAVVIQSKIMLSQLQADAETVQALSMQQASFSKWKRMRMMALTHQLRVADVGSGLAALTRMLRLMLQSSMLGLGAWLVLSQQMTAGGILAASVLLGRALTPIETLLTHWPVVQNAHQSWKQLASLLSRVPKAVPRIPLPKPDARLSLTGVTVFPPGERRAVLRGLNFTLEPGQALGIIGPSGSGKSTLAKLLTGTWPVAAGTVRLGGAALHQYDPDMLGQHIGYLPQRLQLFDGSIAQNIARLQEVVDHEKVIAAARSADAHDMILALPKGYDTLVVDGDARLSGGQIQRIGLARALYHNPAVVILDEPNSNLDSNGSVALNHAIRDLKSRGKLVLIMAHRPAAIQECDLLLMLDDGAQAAFGPKEEVMGRMVKNANSIRAIPKKAAGAA